MTFNELKEEFEKQHAGLVSKGLLVDYAMPLDVKGMKPFKTLTNDAEISAAMHQLVLRCPFIFDRKKLPKTFMGFKLSPMQAQEDIPEEFRADEYGLMSYEECWSEAHILRYAEEHALEICDQLNDYSLTLKDICDIIAFGDFEAHKKHLQEEDDALWDEEDDEFWDEDEDDDE